MYQFFKHQIQNWSFMKRLFILLAMSTLPFVYLEAQRWNPTYPNIDYVGNGNSKQMLDLYIPEGVTSATPLIIHIHGGAFMMGSKGVSEQPSFVNLYNNGYICADINYRLSGDSIWPAQIFDCKAAVRFLKAHADQYFIDTCRIGLIGESAGGHLVSMVGTSWNFPELEGLHLGSTNVTSRVQAVVDLFGPTNFLIMDGHEGIGCSSANHNAANSPESILLGCALPTCPERVASADPMAKIDLSDPFFFISCGDHDCNVAPYSSFVFDSLLTAKGLPHTYELIANQAHGGSFWHSTAQDAKYLAFFNQSLADGCATTAIENQGLVNFNLMVYPNPAKESLTILLSEKSDFDVTIMDSLGRTLKSISNVSGTLTVPCTDFSKGLYLVKASDRMSTYFTKFIKE